MTEELNVKNGMKIWEYGADILRSAGMKQEKNFRQHNMVSCFDHSVSVAMMSLFIAEKLKLSIDERSLVRGALLHDYFLYDWHDRENRWRNMHGITHAYEALSNAERDFGLNDTERDIIKKHMFPVTPILPTCRESVIVTIADKICAMRETCMPQNPVLQVCQMVKPGK